MGLLQQGIQCLELASLTVLIEAERIRTYLWRQVFESKESEREMCQHAHDGMAYIFKKMELARRCNPRRFRKKSYHWKAQKRIARIRG